MVDSFCWQISVRSTELQVVSISEDFEPSVKSSLYLLCRYLVLIEMEWVKDFSKKKKKFNALDKFSFSSEVDVISLSAELQYVANCKVHQPDDIIDAVFTIQN